MRDDTKKLIQDDYWRIKDNLHKDNDLIKMCHACEDWYGEQHDYDECLDKPCFMFYQCYRYLEYQKSWENSEEYFMR